MSMTNDIRPVPRRRSSRAVGRPVPVLPLGDLMREVEELELVDPEPLPPYNRDALVRAFQEEADAQWEEQLREFPPSPDEVQCARDSGVTVRELRQRRASAMLEAGLWQGGVVDAFA